MKKAFTLTELLIALAVLGLLIAILTPIISNLIPEQNALMAKRSYYAIQTIVGDMLNDEACYPDQTQSIYEVRAGFDDGYGYADCVKWGGVENESSIENEDSATKFITLFKNKLDIKSSDGDDDASATFETRDGILWSIAPDFQQNNKDSYARIFIDVNGTENPNCAQAGISGNPLHTGSTCSGRTQDFDVYSVKVYADGKIEIDDDWAIDAVDINKDVTGSEEDM